MKERFLSSIWADMSAFDLGSKLQLIFESTTILNLNVLSLVQGARYLYRYYLHLAPLIRYFMIEIIVFFLCLV